MQHEDIGGLKDLALRRMEVAKEDLETAKMNLQAEHYRAANNRAYYSIYHSITAVFALENISYKRHKEETVQQVETAEIFLQAVEE